MKPCAVGAGSSPILLWLVHAVGFGGAMAGGWWTLSTVWQLECGMSCLGVFGASFGIALLAQSILSWGGR